MVVMTHRLEFDHLLLYDTREPGMSISVTLRLNQGVVDLDAKLDTGASDCIFERAHGEALEIDVESGELKKFGTATGPFDAYGHLVTLAVRDVELEVMAYFAKDVRFNRNVLGRRGFLDRVLLGLNDYEGKL